MSLRGMSRIEIYPVACMEALMIDGTEIKLFLLLPLLVAITACAGTSAIHHKARAGDTVFLALGSPVGMTRQNISAVYMPADGSGSVDLTNNIRALFRLFPDKTSLAYLNAANSYFSWGHEPWLVTMAVDLPSPMPVGSGTVKVNCIPVSSCQYPNYHAHVNDVSIGLEILPGQGEPNPLTYMGGFGTVRTLDPTLLEQQPRLVLTPAKNAVTTDSTRFSAASIRINMPVSTINGGAVPDAYIKVIPSDLTASTNSQRQVSWVRSGDEITLYIVSPTGMTYLETMLEIVLHATANNIQSTFTAPPAIVSSVYFDANGQVIGGPSLAVALK
jgi:hypothetical protein